MSILSTDNAKYEKGEIHTDAGILALGGGSCGTTSTMLPRVRFFVRNLSLQHYTICPHEHRTVKVISARRTRVGSGTRAGGTVVAREGEGGGL
jgi:hypothetical protein